MRQSIAILKREFGGQWVTFKGQALGIPVKREKEEVQSKLLLENYWPCSIAWFNLVPATEKEESFGNCQVRFLASVQAVPQNPRRHFPSQSVKFCYTKFTGATAADALFTILFLVSMFPTFKAQGILRSENITRWFKVFLLYFPQLEHRACWDLKPLAMAHSVTVALFGL